MCGIAGLYYPGTPKPVDPARIAAMADAMVHRGPDGSGVWTAPGVGLGHRRLSIIDLGGGAQPMATTDHGVIVSYNGEIYNFRAVRAELEALGARFQTESDTEVLLHGWRAWGPNLLERLDGMFAFALYDAQRRSLFLARDRFGVKPLHYVELSDGAVAFASELKGLLAHPLLRRQPDFRAVEDFLGLGYVPDDACIVAGVRKLAAGHFLLLERGKPMPEPVRWWDLDFSKRAKGKSADLAAELLERMRAAVRSRMIADVPLGAFLSGGVDSSAVVRADGGGEPRCGQDLHDRLRPGRSRRDRLCQDRRRAFRHPASHPHCVIRRFRADRHFGRRLRRALRRCLGARHLARVRAGARERDGRALRRRSGRGARRLSPLPLLRRRGARARAAAAGAARRRVRHARAALPQGRLGAAPLPRQSDSARARRRRRVRLSQGRGRHRPRAAQPALQRCRAPPARGPRRRAALHRHDAPRPCARRARPRPICRFRPLAARRHPHQARPHQHGREPGGARTAARPSSRPVRRHSAAAAAHPSRAGQMADEAGVRALAAARDPLSPQDGFRDARLGLVPRAARRDRRRSRPSRRC